MNGWSLSPITSGGAEALKQLVERWTRAKRRGLGGACHLSSCGGLRCYPGTIFENIGANHVVQSYAFCAFCDAK